MKILFVLWICIVICVALYLLAIMPRMVGKPKTEELCRWFYAHRGLHDNTSDAPENSIKAFQKAIDAGYGIELDIQLSKDKVPVVFHDYTLERMCGKMGKVCDYTYEELQEFQLLESQEHIPHFEDVLKLVNGKVPLIIEFKIESTDTSLCPIADRVLQDYKGTYCVESFNPLGILWYRQNRRNIVRGQLSDAFLREGEYKGVLYFVLQNLLFNFITRPDFVAYHHKYPNMLSRKICHKLYQNMAAAWTIKSEEQLKEAEKHFDLFIFDSFIPEVDAGSFSMHK